MNAHETNIELCRALGIDPGGPEGGATAVTLYLRASEPPRLIVERQLFIAEPFRFSRSLDVFNVLLERREKPATESEEPAADPAQPFNLDAACSSALARLNKWIEGRAADEAARVEVAFRKARAEQHDRWRRRPFVLGSDRWGARHGFLTTASPVDLDDPIERMWRTHRSPGDILVEVGVIFTVWALALGLLFLAGEIVGWW